MIRFPRLGYATAWVLVVLAALASGSTRLSAQGAPVWQFENVSGAQPIAPCVNGKTLAGFEYGPDGRPVLAWREENSCGGGPRVYWTRQDSGQWHPTEFLSEHRYNGGASGDHGHRLALRPSDGRPFLIYADVGNFNEINTYRSDLVDLTSSYLEGLVGPQNCSYVTYSTAFAPGALAPQWTTGLSLCNGGGPVRLNGYDINGAVENPRASLAIGADGTRHVLWNSGSNVYYSRVPANATVPDLTTQLFNDVNRFGGEVRIAVDGAGVLHAIVRGPDISADWDLGAIVYLTSTDGGNTWSSREYVDPHDDPAIQNPWNGNSDLSFMVDAGGIPAVSFWRWQSELWYARRDGPGATWTQQLVTALPIVNPQRDNQLRLDPNGKPVIAFYDAANRTMRLARPVPPGVTRPIDVAVTATASPTVVPPGATTTFTLTVTNNGKTNVDRVVLENRLPEGSNFISARPLPGADGRWTFALTSDASTTVTIVATAPFAEGAAADVATATTDAADDHPEDNASAAGFQVEADQCFVPHGAGSGLRGWWRGDGSAANAMATPAESINVYGGVSYEPAVIGSGFKFDGTGAVHVYHDNDNFYYPLDGSFTIEAFVKTLSPTGQIASRYECRQGACGPTAIFFALDGDGHLYGYLRDVTDHDLVLKGTRVINDGVFHHVALVIDRDSAEARLYVDGKPDVVMPYAPGSIADSNGPYTPLVIGARFDFSGNNVEFFNGVIDELAIHGRALSAAELLHVSDVSSQPACGKINATNGIDVAVTVEATPLSVAPGGYVNFIIGVTNNGSVDLSGVNVDNLLGGGATFFDAAPNPQSAGGGVQNFNVGSLARGERKWIVVRALAPLVPGTIFSQAHHLVDADQNVLNDESRAVVQVVPDACFVAPDGLVSRWRADGDANDAVGGHAGVLQGATTFEPGHMGQAFSFNGADGTVYVDPAPDLQPAHFTASAWVRPLSMRPGGWNVVLSSGTSLWLGFAGGRPSVYTHGVSIQTLASSPLQPGQWYLLTATYDGANVRLYVNGDQVAQTATSAPMTYDTQSPFAISGYWYGGRNQTYETFDGLIDDVTIHDRALSADEVMAMVDGSNAACQIVVRPVETPIRNGVPESRPQFSGVGMILPSATHGGCTATLINQFTVLTAAQCLQDSSGDPVFEFNLGEGRTARVTDIRVHPLFLTVEGTNRAYDFALASLDRTVAASWTDVIPAALRAEPLTPVVGATAIGFGEAGAGSGSGRRTSGTLLVTSYVVAFDNNFNVVPDAFIEADPDAAYQMFCAAGIGGPLFYENQIVGVASFRNVATCAEPGPGYYVNIGTVAEWIHATTIELTNGRATTTTLTSSVNPSASGQAVTFTATVSTVDGTTPTGDVTFVFAPSNTTLGTTALTNGTASFEANQLPEGTFNIEANFTGNASFAHSSALLTQVVDAAASTAIRNGVPESRPQFSGVGMILASATHMGCTATLISPFIVLTAAECLRDSSPDALFEFSLGEGRTARVTDVRIPPFYETVDGINLAYDYALASLDRTVATSWADVVPATLRAQPVSPVVDATAIGFEDTAGGRRTSGTLVVTEYLAGEDSKFNPLPAAFIEANSGTADQMFCRPGTGGPLFFDDQIVGVASFRNVVTCAEPGPGFYVNIGTVAEWIQSTLATLAEVIETTTTLTASPNPASIGRSVTLTATVMSQSGTVGTPAGTVTFREGATVLGTVPLSGGSASFVTSSLSVGEHQIDVEYGGSPYFQPSQSPTLKVTIEIPAPAVIQIAEVIHVHDTPVETVVVLTASPNPAKSGEPVTLTATVTSSSGTPAGTMTFTDGATELATVALINGQASFSTSSLSFGSHQVGAAYTAPSSARGQPTLVTVSVTLQTVIRIAEIIHVQDSPVETLVAVSASPNPAKSGEQVTFTATVTSSTPGAAIGTATFTDGAAELAAVPLTNGQAIYATSSLSLGSHQISAVYRAPSSLRSVAALVTEVVTIQTVIRITETIVVHDGIGTGNTQTGNNVSVIPIDPATGATPVKVTFSSVTQRGVTSVTTSSSGPAIPAGFALGTPPTYFDITTTAIYTPPITVCINYAALGFQNPAGLRLLHFENGAWADHTVSQNNATTTVCATVNSLSPFVVASVIDLEGRMIGDGEIAAADGREHDFEFNLAERHIGVERGKLNYTLTTPKSAKKKQTTDRFESTAVQDITFWDNPAFKPGKAPKPIVDSVVFSGTGTWNGSAGYTFEARASDEGEPGRGRDTFALTIRDKQGTVVTTVSGTLTAGNIQSARLGRRTDKER